MKNKLIGTMTALNGALVMAKNISDIDIHRDEVSRLRLQLLKVARASAETERELYDFYFEALKILDNEGNDEKTSSEEKLYALHKLIDSRLSD